MDHQVGLLLCFGVLGLHEHPLDEIDKELLSSPLIWLIVVSKLIVDILNEGRQ